MPTKGRTEYIQCIQAAKAKRGTRGTKNTTLPSHRVQPINKIHQRQGTLSYVHPNPFPNTKKDAIAVASAGSVTCGTWCGLGYKAKLNIAISLYSINMEPLFIRKGTMLALPNQSDRWIIKITIMLNQESFCCPGLAKPNSEPIPKLISQTRLETHIKNWSPKL